MLPMSVFTVFWGIISRCMVFKDKRLLLRSTAPQENPSMLYGGNLMRYSCEMILISICTSLRPDRFRCDMKEVEEWRHGP